MNISLKAANGSKCGSAENATNPGNILARCALMGLSGERNTSYKCEKVPVDIVARCALMGSLLHAENNGACFCDGDAWERRAPGKGPLRRECRW